MSLFNQFLIHASCSVFDCGFHSPVSNGALLRYNRLLNQRDAMSHLLHSKWVSLFVVQVFLQVEEGIEEYVGHPAALQVTEGYLTCRKQHRHKQAHVETLSYEEKSQTRLNATFTLVFRFDQVEHLAE